MSQRWTEADLARVNARIQGEIAHPLQNVKSGKAKYGNAKCWHQGMRFDSKHERTWYQNFELQRVAGHIRAVIRQVSLPMPNSGRRIRVDFLIVENDGHQRWVDAKGFATPEWLLKAQIVQDAYGIQIETV